MARRTMAHEVVRARWWTGLHQAFTAGVRSKAMASSDRRRDGVCVELPLRKRSKMLSHLGTGLTGSRRIKVRATE